MDKTILGWYGTAMSETFSPDDLQGAIAYGLPEVARAYEARPTYPSEAIDYMLDRVLSGHTGDAPPRILDAGTGNGLVTEGILKSGRDIEIVALDHVEEMTVAFRQRIQRPIPLVRASFNSMPFADNSFDAVIFGTALHWGDPDQIPDELYRLLRPGGVVASISNVSRAETEFTDIILDLPHQAAKVNPITRNYSSIDLGERFSFEEFREFPYPIEVTQDRFDQLVMSIDPFHTAPPNQAVAAWEKMQDYARRHTTPDGLIPVAYVTAVRIARVKK